MLQVSEGVEPEAGERAVLQCQPCAESSCLGAAGGWRGVPGLRLGWTDFVERGVRDGGGIGAGHGVL